MLGTGMAVGIHFHPETDDNYENIQAKYSPDGNKIAYVSKRDGTYNIYVLKIR